MDPKYLLFMILLLAAFGVLMIILSLPSTILPGILKLLLLVLAVLLDILAFASRYYSNFMIEFLKQRKKEVILSGESTYWLSSAEDALIKKDQNGFTATVFILIPLYRSATEMTDAEKLAFGKQVSSLFTIMKEPIRYTVQMNLIDKDNYLQALRDKINQEEDALSQKISENVDSKDIERAKGKVAMWHNLADNISSVKAYEFVEYATASGVGDTESNATIMAQQKARDVISGVSSIFGITPTIVVGKELLKFVEPEYAIPYITATEEISKNVMNIKA
ncbi:MAG: hypothetical protein QXD11_00440 [Candidatus Micrarchaeaceae archaeon]